MTQKQKAIKCINENPKCQKARVLSVLLEGKPITAYKLILKAKVSSPHRRLTDLRREGLNIPHGIRGNKQTWYFFPTRKMTNKTLHKKIINFEKRYRG